MEAVTEIVNIPLVRFYNPTPEDGPKNGRLILHLAGSPTIFLDTRMDGVSFTRKFSYELVLQHFQSAIANGKIGIVDRLVLCPEKAMVIDQWENIPCLIKECQRAGIKICVLRSFAIDIDEIYFMEVQLIEWGKSDSDHRTFYSDRFQSLIARGYSCFTELIPADFIVYNKYLSDLSYTDFDLIIERFEAESCISARGSLSRLALNHFTIRKLAPWDHVFLKDFSSTYVTFNNLQA